MNIKVDSRIELLTIVQYLGQYDRIFNYPLIARKKGEYQKLIDKHFQRFQDHKAVVISDELANLGFSFDAPVGLILQFSDLPDLTPETDIPVGVLNRVENPEKLFSFIDALKDLAHKANFSKFLNSQKKYYSGLIDTFGEITEGLDFAEQLHHYLYPLEKSPGENCSVILAPLNLGNYGCQRIDEGRIYPFSVLGMSRRLVEKYLTKERIGSLCWHEFAHTYINPLTSESLGLIEESSFLFTKIEEQMKNLAYPEWKICVNETIIRAVTDRLTLHYFGEESYQKAMQEDFDKGFIYIKEIEEIVASFEKGGILSPSILECHREILQYLVRLSKQ